METQRIFLSYAREDSAFVLRLAKDLRAAGVSIWLDQLDIAAGRRWDTAIEEALANAQQLIVILSAASVASNNVMDEVSYALERGKGIFPVKLNECNIPFRLKRLQFIDFATGYDAGVARLLADLGRDPPVATKAVGVLDAPLAETRKDDATFNWREQKRAIQFGAAALAVLILSLSYYEFRPSTVSFVQNKSDAALKDLRIWKVGSPHTGDVPDSTPPFDLQKDSKAIGLKLQIETFPAKGFADKFFEAVERHEEPDVLAIDNYGIIDGIDTPLGHFTGIGTSKQVKDSLVFVSNSLNDLEDKGGWQILVSTSQNYQAAKSLALRQPHCDAASLKTLEQVKSTDAEELHKYALKYVFDSDLFHAGLGGDFSILICGFWGNRNIAFLDSVVTSESEKRLGWTALLIIMEKKASSWELVDLGANPDLIMQLNNGPKLADSSSDAPLQNDLKIIGPADGIKSSRDAKPSLEWQWQGDVKSIVVYLVESQFSSSSNWSASRFTSVEPQKDIKLIAPFGVGAQPHRWRVWAIDRNGSAIRSDWSTVFYID